jgi:hypothetical protein
MCGARGRTDSGDDEAENDDGPRWMLGLESTTDRIAEHL